MSLLARARLPPEVQPPDVRWARSVAEKLRILQEYDAYPVGSPERGALLRCEGIYTSQISKWRKRHGHGGAQELQARPRGPSPTPRDPFRAEVERLSIGDEAIFEVTGLRNPCAQLNKIQDGLMAAVLDRDAALIRKAGVMGVVVAGGVVRPGDAITVDLPPTPHRPLAPV